MSGILTEVMIGRACTAYAEEPGGGGVTTPCMRAALEAVLPMIGEAIAKKLDQAGAWRVRTLTASEKP